MQNSRLNIEIVNLDTKYVIDEICYSFQHSKLGEIIVASTKIGICYIGFVDDKIRSINQLTKRFPSTKIIEKESESHLSVLPYFNENMDNVIPIKLHLKGTSFQLKVWNALLDITLGKTKNYSDIAHQIGNPKAVRAVGTAIGKNPIAYIIPCHRVIQANGNIGNYFWGSERKKIILDWEKNLTEV